jgi:hypothetical protein
MVNFRRVVTVLAVLALFTGLAFAQQENCSAQATSSTPLRGEGFTEQTGDILINCVGGIPIAPGGVIPLVNIQVFYNTTVTSRLLPTTSPVSSNNTSEALLLIDEPNTKSTSYGSNLGLIPCLTPLTGCAAWVGNVAGNGTYNQAVSGGPAPTTGITGTVNSPNVYQGVVNGNSVTFYGVPVLPPGSVGSRVYRITNVRVNAQALAGGSASGASPVQSSIIVSGSASLPISNSAPVVGYVSNGLTASASGATGLAQCSNASKTYINTVTFQENFGTAFKTRVAAQSNTAYAGQLGILPAAPAAGNQSTPGGIYNSESNFVYAGAFGANGYTAGLADFGTRLKATFNNIPAGSHVFVSVANVLNGATVAPVPAIIGGSAANANTLGGTAYVGYAVLVNGESTSDGSTGPGSGFFPNVVATDNSTGLLGIAEVALTNGTGAAVWEVLNTNPNTSESFNFGVYITYTAATATNSPLPGTSTVNLSFAPTATSGAASTSLPIPRFAGDNSAARNVLSINICRTILLYPYITNQAGFDTGLTVANTSQDPFTTGSKATAAQAGSCTFTYYGGTTAAPTTPPALTSTGNIAAGTVWANTLGTIAPNFQGYAFAVCNFQWAHGFAFISDVGARNLAMGYLAIVLDDPGTGSRFQRNTQATENGAH